MSTPNLHFFIFLRLPPYYFSVLHTYSTLLRSLSFVAKCCIIIADVSVCVFNFVVKVKVVKHAVPVPQDAFVTKCVLHIALYAVLLL